jgi:hypothetical protein
MEEKPKGKPLVSAKWHAGGILRIFGQSIESVSNQRHSVITI